MNSNKFLLACVVVYALLTALLIATVPINSAPDEGAHLEYAQYLAKEKALPVFVPKGANYPGYEYHQPPLYYFVAALGYSVLPEQLSPRSDELVYMGGATTAAHLPAYAARVLSLLCGVVVLVFLWHSVRLLFPEDHLLAPLATGFAAVWPMHIAVGASAGNDALAGAMCAGMFWAVARLARRVQRAEYSWHDAALVAIFFGLGMLTKSTCLVVGVAAIGATVHLLRSRREPRVALGAGIVVAGVTLLICSWWLVRNTMLYGDPLAAQIFDVAFKNSSPRPAAVIEATGVSLLEYLRAILLILFATCWGFFGGPNTAVQMLNPFGTRGPRFEAFAALPLMVFPLIATVLALWGFGKWKLRAWRMGIATYFAEPERIAHWWWGVGFGLVVLALARFNFLQYQAQARYLHPALLPMCLIFAIGWREVLSEKLALRIFAGVFGVVLVLLTLWNAFSWKTLV